MDKKEELLWILAENVRHAGLMQQTNAIDLLLAVYFSITSCFGEFSLHYGLPIHRSHIIGYRFVHSSVIRQATGESYQVSQCQRISKCLKHPL